MYLFVLSLMLLAATFVFLAATRRPSAAGPAKPKHPGASPDRVTPPTDSADTEVKSLSARLLTMTHDRAASQRLVARKRRQFPDAPEAEIFQRVIDDLIMDHNR